MAHRIASSDYPARILFGFIAGFLATLSFHQDGISHKRRLGCRRRSVPQGPVRLVQKVAPCTGLNDGGMNSGAPIPTFDKP